MYFYNNNKNMVKSLEIHKQIILNQKNTKLAPICFLEYIICLLMICLEFFGS